MVDLMMNEQQSEAVVKGVPAGFKLTEVGVIPEDWEVVPFFDVVSIVSGQISPICEPYSSMILIAPDHIETGTGRLISKQSAKEQNAISGKYVFHAGDTIYSKIRPYLRKAIYANFDGLCSADMYPLRPKEGIEPKYILPLVLGSRFSKYAESVSVRSGIPKINRSEIADFLFVIPSQKEEQTVIANVLFDTEALIAALEQILAKKQAIKTATMQQLLTGKTRLPQVALREDGTVKGYKKSELGDIPEDWKISKIGELSHVDPENLPSSTPPNYEFDYISLEQIDRGVLLGTTRLVFSDAPSRARRLLRCNDVMVSTVRPNLKSHYLVDHEVSDLICSTGFSVIRCDIGQLHPEFLYQHLFAASINEQIDMLISGSNYPAINSDNVKGLMVPICSVPEQIAIAAILSDMDKEIQTLQQRLDKTRQLEQGMMQELLTGKTRLI
ncbi:restriction endonuclease subunit S [Brenneria uluponensis]|uniref:restriction endonuclease subunit S n=1 Tax=Brenneria uluponensis TaxID=3057057 RepID=UPI0028F01CA2|nr:restriction endonuclease subunit S [Brenneria ulupoensis]